ncbi:MAG: 2Fe-2S iron-sulfur cluster-binding protein [Burkholderiaceae bacterium]|jgi:ferredoxin|nr:2Fe-2S iron-sulfur cluster binding domain-containing protein [Burkholderiaceae bacterium]MCO5103107.1 2Fe-2S iron-sulfur cluster-binding protein [Burkholderiaceae bacterium]
MATSLLPFELAFFTARVQPEDACCDAWPTQALLLSIEQGGIDWPSSCRNGTCRTCMGHLVAGKVRYAIDWPGLTAEELKAGCVLPCVAYPVSDVTLERGEPQ